MARADPGLHSPFICEAFQRTAAHMAAQAAGTAGHVPMDYEDLDVLKAMIQLMALRGAGEAGDAGAMQR
jgi:hypothetical protein